MKIKKKFDYLLKKGFLKKYYTKNDEEELCFTKSNFIITIYKNYSDIGVTIDYGCGAENLLESKLLSSNSKYMLRAVLKNAPILHYKLEAIDCALEDILLKIDAI